MNKKESIEKKIKERQEIDENKRKLEIEFLKYSKKFWKIFPSF